MERILKIKVSEKIRVPAEYVVLQFRVSSVENTEDLAINESARKINELSEKISSLGYNTEDLKTLSFNVGVEKNYVKARYGESEYQKVGYKCSSLLSITVPFDSKKLVKLFRLVNTESSDNEMSFYYFVREPKEAKEKLWKKISASAKEKAQIMASHMGITLGNLCEINCCVEDDEDEDLRFYKLDTNVCMAPGSEGLDELEINNADVEFEDTATFIWEIL